MNEDIIKVILPKRFNGQRIDSAMAEMLPNISRSKITSSIKAGDALLNGHKFKPKDKASGEDIINFNKGYKTILGERGITLSGGQIQRVSIARVFIKNPKIYLFDDCLSAVDNNTEEKILKNLKSISNNKTTIIVSHRIS